MSRLFPNTLVIFFGAALVACGGGSGGGAPITCSGTTLAATVTYASTTLARNVAAAPLTPTVVGIPSACDASKISYSATALPVGMAIASSTGVISGTPTTFGASSPVVTLSVAGYSGTATASAFTLAVDMWTVKTSAHGLANLVTTHLLAVGTDLYVLGSQQVGNNYTPVLYKSSDSGATWTNTATPPNVPSLIHFSATTDGANLYLAGGRTSDATVITAASYTYNNDVLKFTPGAAGAAGSWSTVASNPFANAIGVSVGGAELSAMAYDASNPGTMYITSGDRKGATFSGVHRSRNYGATWFILTGAPQQSGHCLAINSSGHLFSLGGFGVGQGVAVGDISAGFVSTDSGISWTQRSAAALASPYQMSCGFMGSTLYALGGKTKSGTTTVGSVRRSTDAGTTWTADPASATFATRARAGMAVLAGKLMVFGGSSDGTNTLSDVLQGTP